MQTGHQAYQNIIKNHVKPRIGFYLLSQNQKLDYLDMIFQGQIQHIFLQKMKLI